MFSMVIQRFRIVLLALFLFGERQNDFWELSFIPCGGFDVNRLLEMREQFGDRPHITYDFGNYGEHSQAGASFILKVLRDLD